MLFNNNNKFIIYIEISMGIFMVYISIIGPLFCFDCIKFKVSLVIKVINSNGILNMAHLTMFVIFHVNVITWQNFNLPHIYFIFAKKIIFRNEKNQISHMASKHGSNYVKWHHLVYI